MRRETPGVNISFTDRFFTVCSLQLGSTSLSFLDLPVRLQTHQQTDPLRAEPLGCSPQVPPLNTAAVLAFHISV